MTAVTDIGTLIVSNPKICGFRPPNPPILGGKRVKSPPNFGNLGGYIKFKTKQIS